MRVCKVGPPRLMDTGGQARGSGEPKASARHGCVGGRDGYGGDGDVCLGVFLPRRLLSAEELRSFWVRRLCVFVHVWKACVFTERGFKKTSIQEREIWQMVRN